ncbi:MAG: carboxypeptidase-like regulatory domain-containing protein [Polyangiaceae bacterium]
MSFFEPAPKSSACLVVAAALLGAAAFPSCGDTSELQSICGDAKVETGEACDDGEQNGESGHCKVDCSGVPARVSVEGDILAFMSEVDGPRVSGATVTVLEHPDLTVVTGDDAHFRFDDLEEGTDFTLVVEHPDYKTTQTATVKLTENGVYPFSVQVVPVTLFTALSTLVPLPIDEDQYCIVASTVARMGGSLYVHLRQGAAGAAVSLEPAAPAESGPIYFNESVLPDQDQPATSKDGGILFYRVPPGDYVMSGSRADTVFNEVRFQCRAGIIVNAGPPLGLLANVAEPDYGLGTTRDADAYSAATDTLCETTAACVNEEAGATHYPAATVESCKAMFENVWAYFDTDCDADSALRDAAKRLYDCRSADCTTALGGDTICTAEEADFEAAQVAYGACLASP